MKTSALRQAAFTGFDPVGLLYELKHAYGSDPIKICKRLGIRVYLLDDGRTDWDSRLIYYGRGWCIVVNDRAPFVRQVFGVAHELAHRELLITTDILDDDERLERFCDEAAFHFLFK